MKHLNIAQLVVVIILIIHSVSCNKYLDKKADSSLIVPSTLKDLQAILDEYETMNLASTPSLGESSSDDYFINENTYNSQGLINQEVYVWKLKEYNHPNDWAVGYIPIYNSNLCLEQIQKIEKNATNEIQWNNVKGSALFFRSYYFLQLAWIYAKAYDETSYENELGLPLRLNTDLNERSVRNNVRETYSRIIDDAKEAIKYLPDNPQHVLRPSKAAAYGLLARAYLSMRKYDSSFKYANLCLDIKNGLIDFNGLDGASVTPIEKFNVETIFHSEMNSFTGLFKPFIGSVDTILYSSYHPGDLRKDIFFDSLESIAFVGSYAADPFSNFTGIATNEMYLIRAECYARRGEKEHALKELNTLLMSRWKNSIPYPTITAIDSEEALTQILIERRKELLMRGLRWIDIKRLNKEHPSIVLKRMVGNEIFTLQPNANYFALPLPKDVIDLTRMPQNPF